MTIRLDLGRTGTLFWGAPKSMMPLSNCCAMISNFLVLTGQGIGFMPVLDNSQAIQTMKQMNILVWRMDLTARVFENINDFSGNLLCRDNFRFFKDAQYMRQLLLPEDLPLVTRSVAKIKERIPVQEVFRVHDGKRLHWFKLDGWPTENHRYYEGTVEEITPYVDRIQSLLEGRGLSLFSIEEVSHPVAIFSYRNQLLVKCNSAFKDLLGMSAPNKIRYPLAEMVSSDMKLPALFERLLINEQISETLTLVSENGDPVRAEVLLELFSYNTEDMIRLAVVERLVVSDSKSIKDGSRKAAVKHLCQKLQAAESIGSMLQMIYEQQNLFPGMSAAIYSDIYVKKNKAVGYARGALLPDLREGRAFPYSGTIAEHIEKESLEYLIMDDTHASIKAIDWMLFVPNGIHSYIAKAIYVRGAMRTVLILCSEDKQAFNEGQAKDLEAIASAFHKRLRKIRSR